MLGKSYDAILMDIQIPGMDGIETAMKIRQQGFDPQTTPIIAITAPPCGGGAKKMPVFPIQ